MQVALVGSEPSLARALATALIDRGAAVVTIGPDAGGEHALGCDTSSAEQVQDCLGTAEAALGGQPAMIRLGIGSAQPTGGELTSMSQAEWVARAEEPLREALAFHQAAQRFLADRPGRIIVIVPTVGLSGAPGFVPWATTAEADRSLVKAQARVSGDRDVTINCVAVASMLLAGTADDPDRSGLPPYALPRPDIAQVADVVLSLLSPAFTGVTGQTIAVDGGRWMAP
jgi:3-oxoacyl-[acyl-carrier protein] reductase